MAVDDPSYIITFAIMTTTAIVASFMTWKVKKSALEAKQKQEQTEALYHLTNYLTDATDLHQICAVTAKSISNCLFCSVGCLCFLHDGSPAKNFVFQIYQGDQIFRDTENSLKLKEQLLSLRTGYVYGTEFCDWPIYGREGILGVIRIPTQSSLLLSTSQKRLLRAMSDSSALAMEQYLLTMRQMHLHEQAEQERYRSNLLRAISHDLRTPLASIMGNLEMLMDMLGKQDERYDLTKDIYKEADWLHDLVENILSLTKLQDKGVAISQQLELAEEVVGSAVAHIEKRYPGTQVITHLPSQPIFIPMDAKLICQVLINLLDNAQKHSPPNSEIDLSVACDTNCTRAIFTISDHGTGLSPQDLDKLFDAFYTSGAALADSKRGVGLGLTICKAIITAHGGKIWASNKPQGGAEFLFSLPLQIEEEHHAQ